MPMLESSVAITTSQQPSSAALPAKQYPEAIPTSGTRPLSWALAALIFLAGGGELADQLAGQLAAGTPGNAARPAR